MTIPETLNIDDKVMKLLASMSVDRINRLICNTNQGALELEIRKGEKNYHFVLGAVPLKDDVSKELMGILFPIKALEVPQPNKELNKEPQLTWNGEPVHPNSARAKQLKDLSAVYKGAETALANVAKKKLADVPKKRMGRPRGSKDGNKNME